MTGNRASILAAAAIGAVVGAAAATAMVLALGADGGAADTSGPGTTAAITAAQPPSTTVPEPPAVAWEVIGRSGQGRDLRAATFGTGEVRVYVLSAIHGDERAAVGTGPLLADAWAAGAVPDGVAVRLVPEVNPDGVVAATRADAAGVDLNRNFPTPDFAPGGDHGGAPLSEPEAAALAADIEAFGPDVIVALHAHWDGPFAEPDGPADTYAAAFVEAAAAVDPAWEVRPEVGYPTPGSLGTYYGKTLGIPVLTVELRRTGTAEDHWPAVRAGMAALLAAAAGGEGVTPPGAPG